MINPEILDDWFDCYDVYVIMTEDSATNSDVTDYINELCFTEDEIKFVLSSKEMRSELRDYALHDIHCAGDPVNKYHRFITILEKIANMGSHEDNYRRAMSIL